MSRRGQNSDTRSRTLGDYSVGGDSRTCTVSKDGVGQPRKKKFSSPTCDCRSHAIIYQSCTKLNPDRFFLGCPHFNTSRPHCSYFCWLDVMVEENIKEGGSFMNSVFKFRRLRELEERVLELNMELNMQMRNAAKRSQDTQDNKCLKMAMAGLIFIVLVLAFRVMV
ncbi:hypothetical protein PIB30_025435 [Stylosanthes scabra]|uniref:Zinc finger GRF-type domain-containing protein n=1 Tax=Stylosanthes scabra TaxID=79078 RepID=A0ABU6T9W2_9FABA|nr:hypothetical protein [Stylosanthes scabra]